MSKRTLGIISAVPPFAALAAMVVPFIVLVATEDDPSADEPSTGSKLALLGSVGFMLAAVAAIVAVTIFFVVRAARNPRLDGTGRALWILALLFLWPVTPFAYWLAVVRHEL